MRGAPSSVPGSVHSVAPRERAEPGPAPGASGLEAEETVLPAGSRSASAARSFLRGALAGLPAETLDTVLLLATELVSNAVRHGSGPVRLRVQSPTGGPPVRVWVGVGDEDPSPPLLRDRPDQDERGLPLESGRGILLLHALASRWGVDRQPVGKRVWFEVDLRGQ